MHYLYVAAPVNFIQSDCRPFQSHLEGLLGQHRPAIYSVELVLRENILYFQGNVKSPYIKITVSDHKAISRVRSTIEQGRLNYKGLFKTPENDGIRTFDSIQYELRFMIDTGVAGMSWVEAPAGKYDMVPNHKSNRIVK